jgi:hypothetical protein
VGFAEVIALEKKPHEQAIAPSSWRNPRTWLEWNDKRGKLRMMCGAYHLADGKPLSYYDIVDGSVIHPLYERSLLHSPLIQCSPYRLRVPVTPRRHTSCVLFSNVHSSCSCSVARWSVRMGCMEHRYGDAIDAGAKMLSDPDWYRQQGQQARALVNQASAYFGYSSSYFSTAGTTKLSTVRRGSHTLTSSELAQPY